MPGAVDAAANLVDIPGNPADGCGQLFLLGVVHFDDVAVNRHLAEICTHVPGAELRHLVLDEPPLLLGDAVRIGLVRSAIGYSPPSNYNGHFKRKTWYCAKNFSEHETFLHFTTDNFEQKLGTCSEKFLSHFTTDILFAD